MVDHSVVVNEGVKISDSVSVGASIIFEFHERLYVGGTILGSPEIEIKKDQNDPKYITGFAIRITDPTNEKLDQAREKGSIILHYLTAKAGLDVRSKVPMIARVFSDHSEMSKSVTADAILVRNFDLDTSKLSLFQGDPILNARLANYRNGIAAYAEGNFEHAARSYFQVVEKTTEEVEDFKALRDACSHIKIDVYTTWQRLVKLGFKCVLHAPVNFSDPDNFRLLVSQTKRLKTAADNYIAAELARLSL